MLTGPLAYYTLASMILAAARDELVRHTLPIPGRVCVVPGAIAWDNCECDDGQLAVSVDRYYLTDEFPTDQTQTVTGRCNSAYIVAEIIVQIIRCAPQPGEGMLAPTCAVLDASAQQVIADAYAVMTGVTCMLDGIVDVHISDYEVRAQQFVGPEGACVGSELHVLVSLIR